MSQSPVSRNSNIERRMDRPRAEVRIIRGVAETVDVSCLLWAGSGFDGVRYLRAISYFLMSRLMSFTHALYLSWVSFDPSHFAEVFRSLEVVEGIVDRRRCARAKCERYRRLITRGIVALNFSPRNLTQVTSAMKPG